MKIEPLENGNLRVWLSQADMAKFGLSMDRMAAGDTRTEQLLSRLLTLIRQQYRCLYTGVLAEAIPVEGGCILLLTPRRKAAGGALVYRPWDLEALYMLAERWSTHPEPPCTSLYEWGEEYRLVVSPSGVLPASLRRLLHIYGEPVGTGIAATAAVDEHGRLLCAGNALETLINAAPRDLHHLS